MILYHSSNVQVRLPDTVHSRDDLDFGKGFYLTNLLGQAESYAMRFKRRNQDSWLNIYEFVHKPTDWKICRFDSYNDEWLDFISKCRAGIDDTDYDMVIGGIADDKVIRTLDRYFQGEISADQALGILRYERPNIQFCIRSQAMLDSCLHHIESKRL